MKVVTYSFGCNWFLKLMKLRLSVIHTSCRKDYLQPSVETEWWTSRDKCCSCTVWLPRWVLEGKEGVPHVAGMRSSLFTGPPFHMRSNPPTLFSLPVSLHGKCRRTWTWKLVFPLGNTFSCRRSLPSLHIDNVQGVFQQPELHLIILSATGQVGRRGVYLKEPSGWQGDDSRHSCLQLKLNAYFDKLFFRQTPHLPPLSHCSWCGSKITGRK